MTPAALHSRLLSSLAGLLIVLLSPPDARAWVQASTEEAPHLPLRVQDSNCLAYTVAAGCSADVPSGDCVVAVTLGMQAWDLRGSYFRFQPTPEVTCCRAGYHRDWTNTNCVAWREDDWPRDYGAGTIALTTLTYDAATGKILDADIELNGFGYTFGTDCSADVVDIRNTVAHEAGHMLGLDHTDAVGATMRVYSGPGDCSLRDLAADDIEGAVTLYPYAEDPGRCEPPWGGLNEDCSSPPPDSCGCRAPGNGRPSSPFVLLLVALRLLRRRRPHRA